MTSAQKVIKYLAIALAVFLIVTIFGGILRAVGLFGGIFDEDAVAKNLKTYSVNSDIRDLDIQINAADMSIKQSDKFSVESNLKYLKVEERGGTLTVEETRKISGTYDHAVLIIYVPAGTVFENVNLNTGAGRLNADNLAAETLDFDLGAGNVTIGNLTATSSAQIDGGTGRITISNGNLRNLDLQMGVGQLNLTAAVTGNSQMDLGVGESNINLVGTQADYALEIEKALGSITVDGKSVSDYDSNGTNPVKINGGVGSINVNFQET